MNDFLSWLGLATGHNALKTGDSMSVGVTSIRWGLTLLHFLWQGAIIGLMALVVTKLLRNHSAAVRYWLNVMALLACPICVAWTFASVEVPRTWQASSDPHSQKSRDTIAVPIETSNADNLVDVPYPKLDPPQAVSSTETASVPMEATEENPATAPVETEIITSTTSEWMPVVARWIAILYAVGVGCFLLRLAMALWGGHRLRAISTPVSDSALCELIRTQARRIGLKLVPVVAYCERIAVPTVIGVVRPMILLPATLTAGLTINELSAILSHELAHIRRYDLWMNLLQRVIECLLFFHPVIWILSRRLSAERELCCDDLVIRSGHQPIFYVGALLRMAELCAGISPPNSVSLAATSGGTNLLEHRVLRLIHETPSTRLSLDPSGVMLFVGLTTVLAAILFFSQSPTTEPSGLLGAGSQENTLPSGNTIADTARTLIKVEGNSVVTASTIQTMIQIKEGETISDDLIRKSRNALIESRLFFSVKTRVDETPTGAVLVFIVEERPQVRKVEFHGNRLLSEEELEKVAGMKAGAPFDHVWNRETADRIRFEYGQRGYQFAKVRLTKGGDKDDREVVFEIIEGPRADVCIMDVDNLMPRSLANAISKFNQDSKENSIGVSQRPITEQEGREAIAKFAAEKHVPEGVRTQLAQIQKSSELPSNVYFRRFTRFDDGKQMQGVWWVRLVIETGNGPVYSVPVRTTALFARPYTQMERQQNTADGLTLINRVASYYEEPPVVVQPSDLPAASVETLIRKTQNAIKAEDDAAIKSLFESTGASETQREFAVSELKTLSKAKVHSIKVSALTLKGELRTWSAWQYFKSNLPVVGFLEIEYEDKDKDKDAATRRADAQPLAGDRKVLSLELGLVDDELRLVNYVPDGERTPPELLNPGPSITGHLEPLADGTHLVTDIITNPGTLLSAHLANEEIRQRDFRSASEQEENSPATEQPNASIDTPPTKTATRNTPAPETKASADQKPTAAEKAANRYRVLSATGEPVSDAVVRLIYQKQTFRELISHDLKHETTTDAEGSFEYPFGVQVANEMDNGGFSATWITLPAHDGQPAQSWLLGSSAGVRFPFFEAIGAMMRDPKKASPISAASTGKEAKPLELPKVFRLPKFETTIRVVNADGSPAAGVQVTPSEIAWARVEGGSKNIVVPDIVRDSLRQTTDADGRVTFATIDRVEFAEIEFRSEQHGRQRTFTNMNTIGPELEHDVVLFPAGKVTGTIKASTAEQKEFLRTNKLLLQTQVINLGLPAPKGFRIAMEGIAEVTPDEQGRFEIPAMMAGQMFMVDQLPENSLHRITLRPRQITKSAESSLIEGDVISAVKIHGIARKRDSKESVAGIPISINHGGRQADLSRQLTVYPRTDADGHFEAHVFPGRVGYSSLATLDGYVQAWNWDQDYDAKQEWLYGQRVVVPGDTSSFELPPLEFVRTKEIRGKLVDADGKPVANTEVYARARANQNGNDFAKTDNNGEFVLKGFADGYFPEVVQVGEQFKLRPVRIISRDPFILQDSQPAAK
ncbi:MAG: M56 family metallopeptidase [Planctomycetaceae bacterium]